MSNTQEAKDGAINALSSATAHLNDLKGELPGLEDAIDEIIAAISNVSDDVSELEIPG